MRNSIFSISDLFGLNRLAILTAGLLVVSLASGLYAQRPGAVVPVAYVCANGPSAQPPLPCSVTGSWMPPGIAKPWPADEYLHDGGDRNTGVEVSPEWQIFGLQTEDTVAHFDTPDGQTLVQPSNRVHIYAPRFAAVRKVVGLAMEEQHTALGGVNKQQQLVGYKKVDEALGAKQNLQPVRQFGAVGSIIYRGKQDNGALSSGQLPYEQIQDQCLPYENLTILRTGQFEQREGLLLARGVAAAIAWSQTEEVQIILDGQSASEAAGLTVPTAVYTVNESPSCPRLQLIKVASTPYAKPGEIVDFTLRFDNVGNRPIGNVVLLDNLTGRLEYIEDSSKCSLESDFSTDPNEAGSSVLRWELKKPLEVGEGGVIRFHCRVR
jgi:uncharacterized repeat protein (TIGR01451 family)